MHPSRRFLYAVGEVDRFGGQKGGLLSAFAIDPQSGTLTLLNQQSTRGPGPCHVAVDRTGRWALVANYSGGSVACLPIQPDGRLGEATGFVQHKGSSVNPQRQQGPHAHAAYFDAAGGVVFVPDLGLDKVMIYRFDAHKGRLTPGSPPWVAMAPGAGPRHMAFHPNGRFAYVINEIDSTVTALAYDAARGALEPIQSVSTLPEGFHGKSTTAEVAVHPSGKLLYGSNRGHDSIAAFAIDAQTGKLRLIGHESTQGKTPRNFAIDPTGSYLLAANQDSDNVVVFRIDAQSGKLQATGHSIQVPAPVCVEFVQE
jgi:6-phosphogluconolactonase